MSQKNEISTQVALGNIETRRLFAKWGINRNISTSTPADIWGSTGLYTGFPTTAETLTIKSTSANDTAAGTGARTVRVSLGLDENFEKIDDIIVTLNGTTPVVVHATQTYLRQARLSVIESGGTGTNQGLITTQHSTTTSNVFAAIPIGYGQSQTSCFTVPAGEALLLDKFYMSANISGGGAQNISAAFMVRPEGESFHAQLPIEISAGKAFNPVADRYFYKIPEKTDMKMHVFDVSSNNTIVTASFGGELMRV